MPLSPGTKTALTVATIVGVVWYLMRDAKADVPEIITPTPDGPDPIDEPDPPPPPAPPANLCNYLGCPGYKLPAPRQAWTATYAGIRLQQLGYNINPAAPGWSLVSEASMAKVLHFQQNFNHVAKTMNPPAQLIGTDGLFGPRTAAAVDRAAAEVAKRMQSWAVIVSLTP